MAGSVQFRSLDAVLTAYENRNCAAWAICQGSQFMFKYEGSDAAEGAAQLQTILEAIAEGSNAVYTLKVYEDMPKGQKIKSNTPHDGSFNFRLNEESQIITNGQYLRMNNTKELENKIAALEARLQEQEEEDDEPEEDETQKMLGKIGNLMSNPVVQQLASMIFGPNKLPQMPTALAGIPSPGSIATNSDTAAEDARINAAVATLKTKDTNLADHLQKLADIAEKQPQNFAFLLNTLDSMSV